MVNISGTSPGLYTDDELQSIVSQMMPGGVQTKRIDKIEQAFDRFLKRIRQNLHVVVCLSYRGKLQLLLVKRDLQQPVHYSKYI